MANFLKLSSVSKVFAHKSLFSTLNYQFDQGQSYALTGPSGIGKSTLLYLLAGFETPTHGHVYFSTTDLATLNEQQKAEFLQHHIGFIYQVPHLLDELSVAENVMIKGLIMRQPYKVSHDKALELLSQVGLADKASQRPRSLSGGEQQRVSVVRALFSEPSFILADEPTAHLDDETSQLLVDLMLSYTDSGLIIVSHDAKIANQLDHVLTLSDGALVEESQKKENHVE